MKTMNLVLKICGIVMIAAGVVCLVVSYMDKAKGLFAKKAVQPAEYADFADVD